MSKGKKKRVRYTPIHLKHRNIRFWVCWLILAALIAFGLFYVSGYFNEKLTRYEAAQYTHVADQMAVPFINCDYGSLMQYDTVKSAIKTDAFETEEIYLEYLKQLTENKEIAYTQIGSANPDEIRYRVTADEKSFAEFTLKKTGEQEVFELVPMIGYTVGVDLYEPGEVFINIHNEMVYDCTVPDYAMVYVNGVPLDADYVVGEDEREILGGPNGGTYHLKDYRFSYWLGKPDIRVTNGMNGEIPMTDLGQEIYSCGTPSVYSYTIPTNAVITVDGMALGEEYFSGSEQKLFFEGHMYGKKTAYRLRTYSFNYLGTPRVEVLYENGSSIELHETGENTFAYEFAYDDEHLAATYTETAGTFLKQWMMFSTHNVKIATVRNLCVRNSKAFNFIGEYEATWITKADKYEFQNFKAWNFAMLDETTLTCEVYMNYHTVSKGKANDYPTRLRLYLLHTDGNWLVYDFEILPVEEEQR